MRRIPTGESSSDEIVRRMINLPRNMLRGFSTAIDQRIEQLMRIRRTQHHNFPHHDPINFPYQYPQNHPPVQEEFAFLDTFERQYGTIHPFFYAIRFVDALKMAKDEHKFIFMYLHSPDHPFTTSFCKESLCSELVVEYLDANFVCWGAIGNRGEGMQLVTTLKVLSFPFCAVVAPGSGESMAVLQQIEGPVSPAELVEILQRTKEEQGLAFGSSKAKEDEKKRADRRLKEEQDAAFMAALRIDQEKEKQKNSKSEQRVPKFSNPSGSKSEKLNQSPSLKQQRSKDIITNRVGEMQKDNSNGRKNVQVTQIQIRFPNGERKEHTFLYTDKIQAIYRYIDSLGLHGIENYRLISNFPRRVYGVDQMGMSLRDAGLHPKASLFIELL